MKTNNARGSSSKFQRIAIEQACGLIAVDSKSDFSKIQTSINLNYNFYAKTLRMYEHTHGMLAGEATNWRSPQRSY